MCSSSPITISLVGATALGLRPLLSLKSLVDEPKSAQDTHPDHAPAGSLPSELGRWSSLTDSFKVNANALSDSIPSELGAMTGMTSYFYLHSNALSGSIPSELGAM